jgi:hypothetical protein
VRANCQPGAEMRRKMWRRPSWELSSGCKILALRDISSNLTALGEGER